MKKEQINPQIAHMIPNELKGMEAIMNAKNVNKKYNKYLPVSLNECLKKMPFQKSNSLSTWSPDMLCSHYNISMKELTKWGKAFNRLLSSIEQKEYPPYTWFKKFQRWLEFEDLTTDPDKRS